MKEIINQYYSLENYLQASYGKKIIIEESYKQMVRSIIPKILKLKVLLIVTAAASKLTRASKYQDSNHKHYQL